MVPDQHAKQLHTAGRTQLEQGDFSAAQGLFEQALAIYQQLDAAELCIMVLHDLALTAHERKLPRMADSYLAQALELALSRGLREYAADLLFRRGEFHAAVGETEPAVRAYGEASAIYQALDLPEANGRTLFAWAKALFDAGGMDAAGPLFRQSFALLRHTPSWTDETALMEQLVEAQTLAAGLFGGGRRSLMQMMGEVQAQAESGSGAAQQLADAFDGVQTGLSTFFGALNPANRIDEFIANLRHPKAATRRDNAHMLMQLRASEAVEPLFGALGREDDVQAAQKMIAALTAYGDPAIKARLREFQNHQELAVRFALAEYMIAQGESDVVLPLEAALHDPAAKLRTQAVRLLERLDLPNKAELLLPLLNDADPNVRKAAVYALGPLRDPRALDGLLAALQDRYQAVRWASVRVLADYRDPRTTAAMITALNDKSDDVRRSAATTLGKLKDPQALDALTAALCDPWYRVVESAEAALRKLRARPNPVILLAQLSNQDAGRRAAAITRLAQSDSAEVRGAIRRQLHDAQATVRSAAVKALAQLGDRESVPELIACLEQAAVIEQIDLIAALGALGDEQAVPAINAVLRRQLQVMEQVRMMDLAADPAASYAVVAADNPYLRHACIQALARIGTRDSLPLLAVLQLQDRAMINLNGGWEVLRLNTVAAQAAEAIRRRANT